VPKEITLEDIEKAQKWHKQNRLLQFFPDEGPLRRELYGKHIAFFAAGVDHSERLAISGNRCITPWTPIEMERATRRCGEVLGEKEFDVRSWDGGSRCTRRASGVFLKGIEPAFRIHLDNGQFFDCTRRHRVLTREGWLSLDQLIQRAGGLRCWDKEKDFAASCAGDGHPHGGQPPFPSGIGQSSLPSSAHVRLHGQKSWRVGVAEPRFGYSRTFQPSARFSILDDPHQIEALCGQFADPTLGTQFLQHVGLARELQPLLAAFFRFRSADGPTPSALALRRMFGLRENLSSAAGNTRQEESLKSPYGRRFQIEAIPANVTQEVLGGDSEAAIFFPFYGPLIGGNSISFIVPLGYQPILDFTVEETHCYESGGVIHHNTGKTSSLLCFETTLHCTGDYPDWWPGRRFDRPVNCWLIGKTSETTRDILQTEMLGAIERQPGSAEKLNLGTGMIPADRLITTSPKAGVPGAVDTVWIRHKSGGISAIGFKSYGKDRDSFEGTKKDFIGCDEEPPKDVYDEALMRLMATRPDDPPGSMVVTFTPLEGFTEVVSSFLDSEDPDKYYIKIRWIDCAHISNSEIERMSRKYPKYQLKARSEGEPGAGDGVIYERDVEELVVPPFKIPDYWKRAYGMDVGRTAVVWGAVDPQTDVLYLYDSYFSEEYNTVVHFDAIQRRGKWIPGVVDPGSLGSSQVDGRKLFEIYRKMGLDLDTADNTVETGIGEVWSRIQSDRLKIFPTLSRWKEEYVRYHRAKTETVFGIASKVVKKNDHLLDATRYLVMSGVSRAKAFAVKPQVVSAWESGSFAEGGAAGWQVM